MSLQVFISIEKSIQLARIIGGSTIAPLNLDLVVHEGEDDAVNSLKESATSCDNDG
jgi:hypothetical protein